MTVVQPLPEIVIPGKRLGRHIHHDERSRGFATGPGEIRTVLHRRHIPPFNQGNLGSCTGNALAGALSSGPFKHRFSEYTAVKIYKAATKIDPFEGEYPPDDTGSDGLSVCKAAVQFGWLSGYRHAFDFNSALAALTQAPIIVGIEWLDGMDNPDAYGRVSYRGNSRGGHEIEFLGVDVQRQEVRFAQSWGLFWGDHGYGVMSWADFESALANNGDCTIPVL